MILIDANLLLYAVNTDLRHHLAAKSWVEDTLAGKRGTAALAWITLVAFVRISTNPKAMARPLTVEQALRMVRVWLALPQIRVVHPTERHFEQFAALCVAVNARGNLITDVHLAALALEHDCDPASCDADFGLFPGLRWINPLKL